MFDPSRGNIIVAAEHLIDPNLTRAKAAIATCARVSCGSSGPFHRHHRGNEKLLAKMFPDQWKQRYDEFREEDCVKVCEDCHYEITALHGMIIYGTMDKEYEFTWPTLGEAEILRKELIKLTNWWLNHG